MLPPRTIKTWCRIHQWTSLVCTAFMILLCLTGLPLIFHHELEHLLGNAIDPPQMPAEMPLAEIDQVVETARQRFPTKVVQYVTWDLDEPNSRGVIMAPSADAHPDTSHTLTLDARTAEVLGEPASASGFVYILLKLHVDIFAGLAGKLFLGMMGILFVVALISGAVVYGPFMRKLDFGAIRRDGGARLKWLDLHNLLGIVTLVWALVVGVTGVINTAADLVLQAWRSDQLASMVGPYGNQGPPARLAPLHIAVAAVGEAVPGKEPAFVAFPGTAFSSRRHYAFFMRGKTPLTRRLLTPVLVDAEAGTLTDTREMPWYVTSLLLSQPLHFGDYGGMPLKVLWALLDVVTIVVLGSGLYLWVARASRREAPAIEGAQVAHNPLSVPSRRPTR